MNRFPVGHVILALLLIAVFVTLFLLIANEVTVGGDLVHFDRELGTELQENREHAPFLRVLFVALTQVGAVETLTVLVPLGAILFWRRGQRSAALAFLACGIGTGLSNYTTKQYFDRTRPEFKDSLVRETNKSFPSGHASGSIAVFGFLIYLVRKTKLDRRSRYLTMAGLGLLVVSIDFSRIYLGAHYFSDVLGGILLGASWLTLCITASELGSRGQ